MLLSRGPSVLPTQSRRLFRSQWDLDIIYNRWMHVAALAVLLGLLLLFVMQPFRATDKLPDCRVYDPASRLGIALDGHGARQLCTADNTRMPGAMHKPGTKDGSTERSTRSEAVAKLQIVKELRQ